MICTSKRPLTRSLSLSTGLQRAEQPCVCRLSWLLLGVQVQCFACVFGACVQPPSDGLLRVANYPPALHLRRVPCVRACAPACLHACTAAAFSFPLTIVRSRGGRALMIGCGSGCGSVASRSSFEAVSFIHDKLLTNLLGTTEAVARVLIGNKSDIPAHRHVDARHTVLGVSHGRVTRLFGNWLCCIVVCAASRQVSLAEGEAMARKWDCPFIEMSVKVR